MCLCLDPLSSTLLGYRNPTVAHRTLDADPAPSAPAPACSQIKSTVKALTAHNEAHQSFVESMMNALRYTTKHLNDDDTPKAVKTLLGN